MRTHEDSTVRTQDDGEGGHGWWGFARHYLEMVVAMVVGMLVLGTVTDIALTLADVEFSRAGHPELALLEMAFDMSVGMTVWMRLRGHAWPDVLAMCGAMFAPAVALFPLLWLDVIAADSLMVLEHVLMLPLMFVVMLRHRDEYGA
ncbi:hypothetical protein [Streptomyces adelaidensis]|uniref:hypothetical protein n=1 Tax=Streptomyces adelaidensis TaxID=2796465 RepID=UPI001904FFB7|nr:hypothetical protein [Streptomyces adelaidensis]